MNRLHPVLLRCGILSSLWYAAVNVLVPPFWPEYSVVNHTVSELSAIDAPTRTLWVATIWPWVVLLAAFGWGVVRSARDNRYLNIAGWTILALCIVNAYWPPMHLREVLAAGGATLTDTLHLVWAGVTVFLFLITMGFGAAALGRSFRIYTVTSIVLLAVFGLLTSLGAPNVEAGLPTPWMGVWERINTGIFLLWIVVLAAMLLRTSSRQRASAGEAVSPA